MSKNTDWIRTTNAGFYGQVNDTWAYINPSTTTKLTTFGYPSGSPGYVWITGTFKPALEVFNAAYLAWEDVSERTKVKRLTFDATKDVLKKHYRTLYRMFKGNVAIANADLESMAMPVRRSGGNTPVQPPKSRAGATVRIEGPGTIGIYYADEHTPFSRAKPPGVRGGEIRYVVSETMPQDWSELVHSTFSSRTPCLLTFSGDQRGHKLYFAIRWENTTGEKGPWSEIYFTVIP